MSVAAPVRVLYTAEATAVGGRGGHARTSDGRLDVDLAIPTEMGGPGSPGTNPEQLFAAGYAACFQSALMGAARREHLTADDSQVTARARDRAHRRGHQNVGIRAHGAVKDPPAVRARSEDRRGAGRARP